MLAQAVMEAEVTEQIGAGYGERSETRLTRRNGYRERRWDTRVGTIELEIPKLREGSYFPTLLERAASSRWPWSSPPPSTARGSASCWASTSAPPRTNRSWLELATAAFNLVRMAKLEPAPA